MRALATFIIGLVSLSSCSSAGDSAGAAAGWGASSGRVVQSETPKWEGGEAWSVASEPDITIGLLHGPAHYQLFDVVDAACQSDGDIVVVDGGTREIRLFDRDGLYAKTLGRSGSGPGEFQDPAQVLVTATDEILVWDNANYRVTRFNSAGDLTGVQSVQRNGLLKAIDPPLYPWTANLLPDGQVVVRLIEKAGKNMAAGLSRPLSGAIKLSADLSQIDTLMFFGGTEQMNVRAPWGITPIEPPLAKTTLITIHPTAPNVCIGDQEGPEIVCFGPAASSTTIRWTSEAVSPRLQEINTWRDTMLDMYTQKMTESDARRVLDAVTASTVRPNYSRLVLDRAGNLWVELVPVDWTNPEPVEYLVFDPDGELFGTLTIPPIDVLEIGDDYVVGIYRDEVEVEYLHVFAIVKPFLTDAVS